MIEFRPFAMWVDMSHTDSNWGELETGWQVDWGQGVPFSFNFYKKCWGKIKFLKMKVTFSLLTRSGKQPPHGGQEEQQTRWQVDWGQRDRSSLKGRVRPPTNRDTPATNSTWDEYKYARAQKKSTNSNTNMKTNFLSGLDGGFQSSRTVSPRCHRW